MALIEMKVDPAVLERGVRALEKIAQILDEFCTPKPRYVQSKPQPPEALSQFDYQKEAEREEEEEARAEAGLPPLDSR